MHAIRCLLVALPLVAGCLQAPEAAPPSRHERELLAVEQAEPEPGCQTDADCAMRPPVQLVEGRATAPWVCVDGACVAPIDFWGLQRRTAVIGCSDASPFDPTPPPNTADASAFVERVVGPIISRCWACHWSGGVGRGKELIRFDAYYPGRGFRGAYSPYELWLRLSDAIWDETMPPPPRDPPLGDLTAAERQDLLDWIFQRQTGGPDQPCQPAPSES